MGKGCEEACGKFVSKSNISDTCRVLFYVRVCVRGLQFFFLCYCNAPMIVGLFGTCVILLRIKE